MGPTIVHHSWLHHVVDWMQIIQEAGAPGWGLFIGLYALCCLLFVPGSVLTVAAGAVYGFWGGSALVLAGNGVGSLLSLFLTRFFLRDWMARQVALHPRLRAVANAVADDDWKLVFLTHLSPIMPFSLINYSLGLTKISPWRFLVATVMGSVPGTFVYVYIGTLVGNLARLGPDLTQRRPIEWIFQGIGLVLTIGITIYVTRLARGALNKRLASENSADRG
jgi:uncharacterized membrane protein YdjX (TVP38/TMEM64 family)